MGYRFNDNPPKPEDHLRRFAVRNGAIMRASFGCYYLRGHDQKYHDHIGWPNPNNPDAICQLTSNMRLFPVKNKTVILDKIHLIEEGYTKAAIVLDENDYSEYITTTAEIDSEDDNIVRITVSTSLPEFHDKPIDIRFTIFVAKTDESAIDAVCHGFLTILPGAPSSFES